MISVPIYDLQHLLVTYSYLAVFIFIAIESTGIPFPGETMLLVAANRHQMVTGFSQAWRWETVVLAWITIVVATTLHEFAHGLTCKRFGGEVHEVGVLFMFFTPCFFCNVSDAWLIPQKSRRM